MSVFHVHLNDEESHNHENQTVITADTNICPICAYLFKADFDRAESACIYPEMVCEINHINKSQNSILFSGHKNGRSPPFTV